MLSGTLGYSLLIVNKHSISSDQPKGAKNVRYKQHGAFSWSELMTTDIDGAKKFYQKMFNWKFEDMDMDEPYSLAKIDNEEVGGLMPIPSAAENMPAMWGSYITVDDVEESTKQAVEIGGKVLLEPRDIPSVGRFSMLADPQGAMFTVITYFDKI